MPQVSDLNGSRGGSEAPVGLTLDPSEVDDFLRFLLFDIARRPGPLKIRECMQVARYLDWLVTTGVPKTALKEGRGGVTAYRERSPSAEERDLTACAHQIADLLWRRVRKLKAEDAASNEDVLNFLKRHADTHFANPYIGRAIDLVRDFDVPPDHIGPHVQPSLVSGSMSAQGGDPHLQDDLSERLFVADQVLKTAGLRRSRKKIAEMLNEGGIQTRRRRKRDVGAQAWIPEEIHERVKAFEERIRKDLARSNRAGTLKQLVLEARAGLTRKWIDMYRWNLTVESRQKSRLSESS